MKRRWVIVGGCILLAVAVGFQQAEPLEDLRRYGSLADGVGGLKADEYIFMPDEKNVSSFMDSLAVVARCQSVRGLFVPKIDNLKEALTRIAKIEHLTWLRMRCTDPDEDDLAALAGMKTLQFLDVSDNPTVTDAGVAALAGLENLRYLNLTNTSVTGTGFKHRADMVSLYQLNLTDCPVTDESLAAIPHFPKLEELLIGGTEVTDKGLMSLVGWHSLRRADRTLRTTKAGSKAFNEAFLAARRKARNAGEQMDPRDIPPVFLDNWRE
jgi:hypothetical protein